MIHILHDINVNCQFDCAINMVTSLVSEIGQFFLFTAHCKFKINRFAVDLPFLELIYRPTTPATN